MEVIWEQSFEGWNVEAVIPLTGGGLVPAGQAGDNKSIGEKDVLVAHLDTRGHVVWHKAYNIDADQRFQKTGDGSILSGRWEYPLTIHTYLDEGFVVAGTSGSSGLTGTSRAWAMRLDKEGNLLWLNPFGSSYGSSVNAFDVLPDNTIVLAGASFRTSTTLEPDLQDAWVAGIDPEGQVLWQNASNETWFETRDMQAVSALADGTFASIVESDEAENQLKIHDNLGSILAEYSVDITSREATHKISMIPAEGGGITLGGAYRAEGARKRGGWVMRITEHGETVWKERFASQANYTLRTVSLSQHPDAGTMVTTEAHRSGPRLPDEGPDWSSAALLHFDSQGQLLTRHFFGEGYLSASAAVALPDGALLVSGNKALPKENPDEETLGALWVQKLKPVAVQ